MRGDRPFGPVTPFVGYSFSRNGSLTQGVMGPSPSFLRGSYIRTGQKKGRFTHIDLVLRMKDQQGTVFPHAIDRHIYAQRPGVDYTCRGINCPVSQGFAHVSRMRGDRPALDHIFV